MASTKGYMEYVMEQLSALEGAACRAMMGEYVLYCQGKVFGGIYDDRLLVKQTPSALAMMPSAARELPYPGVREMLLVDDVDDQAFLTALVEAMLPELPAAKGRKK